MKNINISFSNKVNFTLKKYRKFVQDRSNKKNKQNCQENKL